MAFFLVCEISHFSSFSLIAALVSRFAFEADVGREAFTGFALTRFADEAFATFEAFTGLRVFGGRVRFAGVFVCVVFVMSCLRVGVKKYLLADTNASWY